MPTRGGCCQCWMAPVTADGGEHDACPPDEQALDATLQGFARLGLLDADADADATAPPDQRTM